MDNYTDPIQAKDEESNLDAEFIKVEKESVCSDKSSPSRDLLEAQEKVQELEHELVSVSGALKKSESEVTRLNDEVSFTNKKLQECEKNCDELEISNKKLQKQISEAQGTKQRAYDDLQLELESSKKKMLEVNQELQISEGEALKFERLLEMAKVSAVEVENQMATLQGELMGLYEKIAENEKLEEALRVTTAELSTVQGELKLSKSQVLDLEELLEKHRDLEVKLQEVIADFNTKDFEVQALEEQVMIYKEQTMEAAERSASLKDEFDQIALKLANSETTNEELKRRVLHAEDQATQSFSEIDMLVETNTQLKSKINELQESHKTELEQTLRRLKHLESMVEELQNRSSHFEKECEGLAGVNFNLTQELSEHESKLNDIQTKLSATLSDRDEATEQLHASRKEVEDLKLQLDSDSQRLQSQISSLMEENNLLTEKHQNAKEELQTAVIQLEGQIKQHKSNEHALTTEIENMKAELEGKSALSDRLKELEEKLAIAEAQAKEEKVVNTQKEMEADANKKAVFLLENKVKELEQKLQLEDAKTSHKDIGASPIEMKSRDIGSSISTPSKHGHTRKLEEVSTHSSSLEIQTKTTEVSSSINFKFILVVALVSVIIGAILGKRY